MIDKGPVKHSGMPPKNQIGQTPCVQITYPTKRKFDIKIRARH